MDWKKESPAYWDESKVAIVGAAPEGAFTMEPHEKGTLLPGEWWRVEEGGKTIGFGWMDITWGDGEVLLAVEPGNQSRGVGTFILDRLEEEARSHGLNYIYNQVNLGHPDFVNTTKWLESRGFVESGDGILRRSTVKGS